MTTPFQTKYARAQHTLALIRNALVAVNADLGDLSVYFKDNPSFLERDLEYLVEKADALALYAHEVLTAVKAKREDGREADARLDVMIGGVH